MRVWDGWDHNECGRHAVTRMRAMPPTSSPCGSVRSAAVINEEIRALMRRAGGHLRAGDRPVYERLLEEWAAAVRAEMTTAA